MGNPAEIDREALAQKRDLLGHLCFTFHFAVMIYIVAGWLVPWRPALVFYLLFIPAIYMQWLVNKDTCILNNVEGFMRTGRWRNKEINPEEGAWLLTLANNVTGLEITTFQIAVLTYSVLALVWLLALARLFWRI
jgi:hypothetical protein